MVVVKFDGKFLDGVAFAVIGDGEVAHCGADVGVGGTLEQLIRQRIDSLSPSYSVMALTLSLSFVSIMRAISFCASSTLGLFFSSMSSWKRSMSLSIGTRDFALIGEPLMEFAKDFPCIWDAPRLHFCLPFVKDNGKVRE